MQERPLSIQQIKYTSKIHRPWSYLLISIKFKALKYRKTFGKIPIVFYSTTQTLIVTVNVLPFGHFSQWPVQAEGRVCFFSSLRHCLGATKANLWPNVRGRKAFSIICASEPLCALPANCQTNTHAFYRKSFNPSRENVKTPWCSKSEILNVRLLIFKLRKLNLEFYF